MSIEYKLNQYRNELIHWNRIGINATLSDIFHLQSILEKIGQCIGLSIVRVIGVVFEGSGKYGDFDWMIQQPEYEDALFIFNDNDRDHAKNVKGGGNAVIRVFNKYGNLSKPRSAGIATGSPGKGYQGLTDIIERDGGEMVTVKQIIDSHVAEIIDLIKTHGFRKVFFSKARELHDNKEVLGVSIFQPSMEVRVYITKQIQHLQRITHATSFPTNNPAPSGALPMVEHVKNQLVSLLNGFVMPPPPPPIQYPTISRQTVNRFVLSRQEVSFAIREMMVTQRSGSNLPALVFGTLYSKCVPHSNSYYQPEHEKFKCIWEGYMKRWMQGEFDDVKHEYIQYSRHVLSSPLPSSSFAMTNVTIGDKTFIEDSHHALQVDFANRSIGGGVLSGGYVQEEIRFAIEPELLVSMIVFELMDDNECIQISGTKPYCTYTGYAKTFAMKEVIPLATFKATPMSHLTCIDAADYRGTSVALLKQVQCDDFDRDLTKAYIGFLPGHRRPVSTGHWGCGAFLGDIEIKSIQQWIAASMCGREVIYHAWDAKKDDRPVTSLEFGTRFKDVIEYVKQKGEWSLQKWMDLVHSFKTSQKTSFFDHITNK